MILRSVKKNVRMLQAAAAIIAIIAATWNFAKPFYDTASRRKPVVVTGLIATRDAEAARRIIMENGGPVGTAVVPDLFTADTEWVRGDSGVILVFYVKNHDRCILIKSGVQIVSEAGVAVPVVTSDPSSIRAPTGYNVTTLPVKIPENTPTGVYRVILTAAYSCGTTVEDIEFPRPQIVVTDGRVGHRNRGD